MTVSGALKRPITLMLVGGVALVLVLSGCGRRGPLDPPPLPGEQTTRQQGLFGPGASGSAKRSATEAPDRPFFLDPLI